MSSSFDLFPVEADDAGVLDDVLSLDGDELDQVSGRGRVFSVPPGEHGPVEEDFVEKKFREAYNQWNVPTRLVDKNDAAFAAFAAIMETMQPVPGCDGLYKRIVEAGDGSLPDEDWLVIVNYQIYQPGLADPVDSTYEHLKPCVFRIGRFVVLRGLDLAVRTMKYNEAAEFYLEPHMAYDVCGDNSKVNSRIRKDHPARIFIHLVDTISNPRAREMASFSLNDMKKVAFDFAFQASVEMKDVGNNLLTVKKKPEEAENRYKLAITWLRKRDKEQDEHQEREKRKLMAVLYMNLSKVLADGHRKGPSPKLALDAAEKAIEHACYIDDPLLVSKANYRAACAAHSLKSYEKAQMLVNRALELRPKDGALLDLRELVLKDLRKARSDEAILYKHMLKAVIPVPEPVSVPVESKKFADIDEDVRLHVAKRLLRVARATTDVEYDVPEAFNGHVGEFIEQVAKKLDLTPVHWTNGELVTVRKPAGYILPPNLDVDALAAV